MTRRPMPSERTSLTHRFALPGKAADSHLAKVVREFLASKYSGELPLAVRDKLWYALEQEFPDKPTRVKGYLTVGQYEDGTVGEIFVKMDKQGSQISGFVDCWAIAVSMLLQSGTPLTDVIAKFRNVSFEPAGLTGNSEIPFARSPVDYIVNYLERRFARAEPEEATGDFERVNEK